MSSTKITKDQKLTISFTLKNTGKTAGEEVVQLYLKDRFGCVVRPVKELKDFAKPMLKAGEMKTITFEIDAEKLSFFNDQLEWIAEPGMFDLMIGSSSEDIRLSSAFELVK